MKYDVSEKNENNFIYKIYREGKDIFILEDENIKKKNKIRNTLIRFIFSNDESKKKKFNAQVKKQKGMKIQTKKNSFFVDMIRDLVRPNEITNFWTAQRLRDNLDFIKKDDIVISIGFDK